MNEYALEILQFAYEQYQQNQSVTCSMQTLGNANDMVGIRNALRVLVSDGYIENLSGDGLCVSFDISALGIEYMRSYRKL